MTQSFRSSTVTLIGMLAGLMIMPGAAAFARPAKSVPVADSVIAEIQSAIDEERYADATGMLVQSMLTGATDLRLSLLNGEVDLRRGHAADAVEAFHQAEADPRLAARALEGEGVALSAIGRSGRALTVLQAAVVADPSAWRAWNALGGEYDNRREWAKAEDAYQHALSASDNAALPLNNRGYSRMLQSRLDDATADFVAALEKKPDFAVARNNLRLTLALKGEYDRSLAGSEKGDQAAMLNNAGFAAMTRGDYAEAETLLGKAVQLRGEFYGRAEANLDINRTLAARKEGQPSAAR